MTRRWWLATLRHICVCAAVTLLLGLASAAASEDDFRFLRIGTAATGGTYFPVGGVIANTISNPPGSMECDFGGSCGVAGVVAAAVSTQGSVENARLVASAELELALVQADVAHFAHTGTGPFAGKAPLRNLRAIANLYPETLHVLTHRIAGIDSLDALAGLRVSLGEPDSGTRPLAVRVLDAAGVPIESLHITDDTVGRSADMLTAGEIDALFLVGGHPINALFRASLEIDAALLSITGAPIADLVDREPYLTQAMIPTAVYPGIPQTRTIAVGAQLVTAAETDAALVRDIVRALWDPRNRAILDNGHPIARRIILEAALDGIAIPLHDGAVEYYSEINHPGLQPLQGNAP